MFHDKRPSQPATRLHFLIGKCEKADQVGACLESVVDRFGVVWPLRLSWFGLSVLIILCRLLVQKTMYLTIP